MIEKYKSRRIRVAIRHVLMEKWDPIGVADVPEAYDEYDSYIGDIFRLLQEHTTRDEIADHLCDIETRAMGLSETSKAHDRRLSAVDELQRVFHEQMLID